MATDITIGRFGSSTDIGLARWDVDGDQVRADGYITNTDTALLALGRQQLTGLSDSPDEGVVPVTVAEHPSQDGYYRVDSTAVAMDVNRYAAKSLPWSASLTRLVNFAQPGVEIRTRGDTRVNTDSFVDGSVDPTIAIPADSTSMQLAVASSVLYATAFGNVSVITDDALFNARTRFKVAPTDYYDGACRVEQKIGSVWYPVVGRRVKAAATDIRVNNGLLRMQGFLHGTATSSGVQMESFVSGSTWGAAKQFALKRSGANLVSGGPATVQVLRNTPEEAIARWTFPATTASNVTSLAVTVRLRRGHRMSDVTLTAPVSITYRVQMLGGATWVAATGGYQESSDDASAQRAVFARRSTTSLTDTDASVLYGGPGEEIVFGLGVRETGGAGTWGTIGDTMSRWFAYVGETQRVRG